MTTETLTTVAAEVAKIKVTKRNNLIKAHAGEISNHSFARKAAETRNKKAIETLQKKSDDDTLYYTKVSDVYALFATKLEDPDYDDSSYYVELNKAVEAITQEVYYKKG